MAGDPLGDVIRALPDPARSSAHGRRECSRADSSNSSRSRARSSPSRAVLLLDEPSLGLAPTVVDLVFSTLATIRDRGLAILLVEQRAQRTVALADRTHVLANGELRLTLTPDDAADTDRMVAAYLS